MIALAPKGRNPPALPTPSTQTWAYTPQHTHVPTVDAPLLVGNPVIRRCNDQRPPPLTKTLIGRRRAVPAPPFVVLAPQSGRCRRQGWRPWNPAKASVVLAGSLSWRWAKAHMDDKPVDRPDKA